MVTPTAVTNNSNAMGTVTSNVTITATAATAVTTNSVVTADSVVCDNV